MAQITLNSSGVASNGTLALQSNGTTTAVTIDASQKVGIGTASPSEKLHLEGSGSQYMRVKTTTTNADMYFGITSSSVGYVGTGGSDPLAFYTAGTERARIDSSGSLLVGTSSLTTGVSGTETTLIVKGNSAGKSASLVLQNNTGTGIGYLGVGETTGITYLSAKSNHPLVFQTNDTERARIDSSGNLGIGTTSPSYKLHVRGADATANLVVGNTAEGTQFEVLTYQDDKVVLRANDTSNVARTLAFENGTTEAARITNTGNLLVGKTSDTFSVSGARISSGGVMTLTTSSNELANFNRLTSDGALLYFSQDSTIEGSISVSGTTVSYNGGHLSRWAQTTTAKDDSIVKGTVLSNLDEMNVYTDAEGNTVDNEQLNKVKVSNVEGDINVAGVFVNWSHDEDHNVDEINMAMTGDMIIRIAQGVTVARGDLLMSAGDGTAMPQGDDIVRSKTIAKVTSNHVTCTYADGSYCVPCVLMAC